MKTKVMRETSHPLTPHSLLSYQKQTNTKKKNYRTMFLQNIDVKFRSHLDHQLPFYDLSSFQTTFAICSLQPDFYQVRILADEALCNVLGLLAPGDNPGLVNIRQIPSAHGKTQRWQNRNSKLFTFYMRFKKEVEDNGRKIQRNQALGNQKVKITRYFFFLSLN